MNVLTKDVPKLDPNDPKGSLEKIYNYLFDIMEQIDYTLSRQGIQLGKVSLPATAKQIEQIAGQVSGLNSNVSVLSGTVNVVNDKASDAIDAAAAADGKAAQAMDAATMADGKAAQAAALAQQAKNDLEELAARVTALEHPD